MANDNYRIFAPGKPSRRPDAPTAAQLKLQAIQNRINHPQGSPTARIMADVSSRKPAASKVLA